MEHLEFFQLPTDPFQNDSDARFYYESAPQKRARLRLLRGIHQKKSLSVLVGGPGLGKTTLAQVVLRTLEDKDYAAHYLSIPHEACSSGWLLPNVARAFGVPVPAAEVSQQIDQIQSQLVAITTARRMPVLLIDEAQLFRNRDAMEEFRGLLNLTHDGKKLLSLVLFGLHDLGEILKLDPPLAQRVEVRVEMTAMDWLESQAYVSHRLRLAGAAQAVFSPDALEALFRWSGGVPRLLNTLADNSLFEAFLTETKPVDSTVVQAAAEALGLYRVPSDSLPNIPPVAPPAPDLLASHSTREPKQTMPVSRPSPAMHTRLLDPDPEPEPETRLRVESTDSSPDWLEPLSPMPEDVPAPALAAEESLDDVELAALVEASPEQELDLEMDLEEVVAEDTQPPTPARARLAAKPVVHELAEPEPEEAIEEAEEVAFGTDADDDDDADFSLGALVRESDSDGEEEAALAELGSADEIEDLAPVRRTPPVAKPAPAPRPMTPAKATLATARPAPAKPTPMAAKPIPPKPTPAKGPSIPTNDDDGFDLRSLVDEDNDSAGPASGPVSLKPPAKDDDDDLDALFDEIQIGDK